MSTLLSEAIIDAKALREAALKNAETAVIEKYSQEVKETLDNLLEQDEIDLGDPLGGEEGGADLGADLGGGEAPPDLGGDLGAEPAAPMGEEGAVGEIDEDNEIPLAATDNFADLDGKNLQGFPNAGEPVDVTIDLGALQEAVAALGEELSENQEFEINEDELADLLSEEGDDCAEDDTLEETGTTGQDSGAALQGSSSATASAVEGEEEEEGEDVTTPKDPGTFASSAPTQESQVDADALIDAIMEKLTVDMGADLSGWAGRSSEDMKWAMSKALAQRRSTDAQDHLQTLKKAQEELVFENKQLTEQNTQYKQAVEELRENLQDVNLSNARLLYTNRILRNTSLNERQKDKIVEAISNAGSVPEARTIFETLQSTVAAKPKRSPQSLSEAISRRSSTIRASRQEVPSSDPLQERMKRLAGIK
jgi:hypothetical protein